MMPVCQGADYDAGLRYVDVVCLNRDCGVNKGTTYLPGFFLLDDFLLLPQYMFFPINAVNFITKAL